MNTSNQKQEPSSKFILIVEDEESIVEFLKFYLTKQGFNVETASDGNEALQKIKDKKPDLIILDIILPKKSGYEIVKLLQQSYRDIPVIIITGHSRDMETQMMFKFEPNVKEFFIKPVPPDVLISKIHNLLNTKPKEETIAEEKVQEIKKQFEE
ncbi:MAG: response regulator [Endomicrobia bacterium]|nr:response regulator [Endomicrobiia bacterium]